MASRYHVHCMAEPRDSGHVISDAATAAEAAVVFTERWPCMDPELSVLVEDCETGAQECYTVDLGAHEAEPCA